MKEEQYKLTLLHVIKWFGGNGMDSYKPVNPHYANAIVDICRAVAVDGLALEEAIKKYGGNF